ATALSAVSEAVTLGNPADTLAVGTAAERSLIVTRPKSSRIKTLPGLNPTGVTEPYWDRLRPFVLTSLDQCAPPPPVPFSEAPGSEFLRQVKAVYDTGSTLTPEQREIALYWADNPGESGTPPGHWLLIASQLAGELQLDAERTADMLVLTSVAMADAVISCWHEKFSWSLIRPVTDIPRVIDPRWHTLISPAPFPAYPRAHAVQSLAAAGPRAGRRRRPVGRPRVQACLRSGAVARGGRVPLARPRGAAARRPGLHRAPCVPDRERLRQHRHARQRAPQPPSRAGRRRGS